MKSGWKTKPLGELAELRGRIGWRGLTAKEYQKTGPLFLSVHSLNYGDYVDFRDAFRISEERYIESPEIMLQVDDVLICKDGAGIGKLGIVGELPERTTINSSMLLIRSGDEILPKFLYRCLSSPYFQKIVNSRLNGATTPHLYQRDITEFPVILPPLPEQHRIVAILDEVFEGIATAKVNAEKNLQNARSIFESHLQSVFTERGKTWKLRTLQEIATTFGRGKSKHRPRNAPHLYGGKYPFVQTGDIRNAEHIINEYSQTYSEAGLAQSKLWPKGTICITIAANIAETAILGFDACFPDSVIGVVANPKEANVGFIEYLLQSFKARIQAMGKGSAQANINMGTFENERFPLPSVTEQQSMVAELDGLNRETQRLVSVYERKLVALEDLKKSLLHRAFAGELTANEAAELVEAVA
jgi:type I restriction enzyme, S subunit